MCFFLNLAQNDDTIGGVKTHSTIWVETVYVICRMENENNQSESNYIDVGGEIWQRREEAREKEQCRDGVTRRNRLQQRKPKGRIAGGRTRIKDNERRRQEFFLIPKEEETKFVCVVNQFSCSMSQCLLINVKIDVKCFIVRCYAMYYFFFYLFQYRCKQVTKTFFFFTLFPFSISHRQNNRGNRV